MILDIPDCVAEVHVPDNWNEFTPGQKSGALQQLMINYKTLAPFIEPELERIESEGGIYKPQCPLCNL